MTGVQTCALPISTSNIQVSAKLWGGGGGSSTGSGSPGNGAGGGYANGTVTLASGVSYQLIVGGGGQGTSAGRTAAGGGAGCVHLSRRRHRTESRHQSTTAFISIRQLAREFGRRNIGLPTTWIDIGTHGCVV